MRAMPIVAMEPERQFGGALLRCVVGPGIGPFAQGGLDEAFGLAIGLGRIGPGADVLDGEPPQRLGVAMGAETCAVVGHDALDLDAVGFEEAQGVEEKPQAGAPRLIGEDFRIDQARMVVDGQVHVFPANAAAVALPRAIAGDAMAGAVELTEFLDVDMDEFAGRVAFVATHRFSRRQGLELVQAKALEDATDRGRRDAGLLGDMSTRHAQAAQYLNPGSGSRRRRAGKPVRPGTTILEANLAFPSIACHPFVNRLHADRKSRGDGRWPLSFDQNAMGDYRSTARREAGILMDVHSVPRESLKL